MIHWTGVRRFAQNWHARARALAPDDSAAALLRAAAELTGIHCRPLPAGDPLLHGSLAVLDPQFKSIWFDETLPPGQVAEVQAHEYGHYWIDRAYARCDSSDLHDEAFDERLLAGVQRVEGYGPRQRREAQANVFAREFLLPTDRLRRWYLDEKLGAAAIAARTGLTEPQIWRGLTLALLTPPLVPQGADPVPNRLEAEPALDESQRPAAHVTTGPTLVEAGPGTGKTRTLIGRAVHLLAEGGVAPGAILGLTFSNKAAEEMRARLAQAVPDAAPQVWLGTFHSFGLELLRQHGSRLGLSVDPAVIDPTEALFLIEEQLPRLRLVHYQNLYEPTITPRDILSAISRAKDELVGPERYRALGEAMMAAAQTDDEREAAEKALEVADVYAIYQAELERRQRLDFGDLIARSVALLQRHPDIRGHVRRQYRHILVDEFQDVNRASGVLLNEIAGDGQGLWVVGDIRQAIYRFRGAAPRNVRELKAAYPGLQTFPLMRNYRARPEIMAVYAAVARRMQAGRDMDFAHWDAERPAGGVLRMEVAVDDEAEARGVAAEIQRQREAGIPYAEQAVLCRSHTTLARLAEGLQAAGVPVLYLGDLFERPEVRDLLALVALAAGEGSALVRVARLDEYEVPLEDVLTMLRLAQAQSTSFPAALSLTQSTEISARGRAGLERLARHLDGVPVGTSAWGLLASYLFERSAYLRGLLVDPSPAGVQRRLALHQFLQFAADQRAPLGAQGWGPLQRFLDHVRRLELFGEERQLRQLPAWADGLGAVRLMTVHAAKGLQFRAVYMPGQGRGHFPAKRQANACPPPAGMVPDDAQDWHDEEEECLFFVGLSRARDVLCISRARRYGRQNSHASDWLGWIADLLPAPADGPVTWPAVEAASTPPELVAVSLPTGGVYEADALDQYLRCPAQHYYERLLALDRWRDDPPYVRFHRCVYGVLRWVAEQHAAGVDVDEALSLARLDELWATTGPGDHPYGALYLEQARDMLRRALRLSPGTGRLVPAAPLDVVLAHGTVRLVPDQVFRLDDGGLVLQRLRTGRLTKSELDKPIYGLYQRAASLDQARAGRVELVSLATGASTEVGLTPKKVTIRLEKYDQALAGMQAGRFSPRPNERNCPRCPHFFVCPAGLPEGGPTETLED